MAAVLRLRTLLDKVVSDTEQVTMYTRRYMYKFCTLLVALASEIQYTYTVSEAKIAFEPMHV